MNTQNESDQQEAWPFDGHVEKEKGGGLEQV
jgi:hypothetical protein